MPNRNQYKTNEEYNAYFRKYNNSDKVRKYKREWAKRDRLKKKLIKENKLLP